MLGIKMGDKVPETANHRDECRIGITRDGRILLTIFMNAPADDERQSCLNGSKMQITLCKESGILFFCFKMGSMRWMEAPYYAGLEGMMTYIPARAPINEEMLVYVFDSSSGECLCACTVKLAKEMTNAIRNIAREQYGVVRHPQEYVDRLQEIYHAFSTESLVMRSTMACEDTLKPINEPGTLPKSETDKLIAQVPKEIRFAYTYNSETGHSILAIPSCFAEKSKGREMDYLVPMPMRYVLEKGYVLRDGYLYVDVKYDPVFGADIPEEYFDYMEK